MRRATARGIHSATNLAYWIENPDWHAEKPISEAAFKGIAALPFDTHKLLKRIFYNDKVIAVNGETVVALKNKDEVDKFMFRYPGNMSLGTFETRVGQEVGHVTKYLAGVALPTQVSTKQANVFRDPRVSVKAVAQTQSRLFLTIDKALDVEALAREAHSKRRDKTAKDLETLITGADGLSADYGLLPDVAENSGNLRRNIFDGRVSLLDVMPFYSDGNRLIGDGQKPSVIAEIHKNVEEYRTFVGLYGG